MKEAFNAFTRAEVLLAKKLIQKRRGNFQQCLTASQTGYFNYAGFLRNYMRMNVQGMSSYMNRIYDWESNVDNICIRKPYPAKSTYTNWNKCLNSAADYMAADRQFGQGYMTRARSNWTSLSTDLTRMQMDSFSLQTNCNRNRNYIPYYRVSRT